MTNLDCVDSLSDIRRVASSVTFFFKVIKIFRGSIAWFETLRNGIVKDEVIGEVAF